MPNDARRKTWVKLYHIVKTLGPEGMSDEEDGVDGDAEVLEVSLMRWRRPMAKELRTVDRTSSVRPQFFEHMKSDPVPRIRDKRSGDRNVSTRSAFKGRPRSFYAPHYISGLFGHEVAKLEIVEKDVEWVTPDELDRAHDF